MKRGLWAFVPLLGALTVGSFCSCSVDAQRNPRSIAFLGGIETAQIKSAVATEQLHSRVTARLDENGTRRLLTLIGHGRPPKVTKVPYQDSGYVPVSYLVLLSGAKAQVRVTFFGRCESCVINGDATFDFGDEDATMLSALIDPKHLWIY